MLLNSAIAKKEEKKFLEECGGYKLYSLTGKRYGISLNTFRIGFSQNLLHYTNNHRKSKISSLMAKLSFSFGYIFGIWLSWQRVVSSKKTENTCLIFYSPTPNHSKHARHIRDMETSPDSCFLTKYLRLKHIIMGATPNSSIFEVKYSRQPGIEHASLSKILSETNSLFYTFRSPPRFWFRYGLSISPLMYSIVAAAHSLAKVHSFQSVYFTEAGEMTSILADVFKQYGIRTVRWFHGAAGMPFLLRSTCDEAVVYEKIDKAIMKKYSFEKTISVQSRISSTTKKKQSGSRSIYLKRFGYATNLFCRSGPQACLSEFQNQTLIEDGKKCNEIISKYVNSMSLKNIYLKIHPRETINSYNNLITSARKNSQCRITIVNNIEDLINKVDSCICHPTSLAIELLESRVRVYIFRSPYENYDPESSIGKIIKSFGFDSLESLKKLISVPDKEYWQTYSNIHYCPE